MAVVVNQRARGERGTPSSAEWVTARAAPTRAFATYLPYYSWANRGPSTMRVWTPEATPTPAGD